MRFTDAGFEWSWTQESAWWLGVTWGAGNVYQSATDSRVTLCETRSVVRRWLDLVAPHKEPHEFKRNPGSFQGYVDSKVLVEWFKATYGLGNKDSTEVPWPEEMPRNLCRHFIRGLFDSKGSLSPLNFLEEWRANGSVPATVSFNMPCETLVRRLHAELKAEILVLADSGGAVRESKTLLAYSADYRFKYTGTYAYAIADYLYDSYPAHLVSDAKLQVYDQFNRVRELKAIACPCGKPASHEGMCRTCWWDRRGRKTGAGTVCLCGKSPIFSKGMCSACYMRHRRANKKRDAVPQ